MILGTSLVMETLMQQRMYKRRYEFVKKIDKKKESGKFCLFVVFYVNTILEFIIMQVKFIFKLIYRFSIYYIFW